MIKKKKKINESNNSGFTDSHTTISILLIFYGTPHKDPGPVVGPFKK